MSRYVLHARASIMCPHGGTVTMVPTATRVTVDGDRPLRIGDVGTIAGCPFTVGPSSSPCIRTEWTMPANRLIIEGAHALVHTSVAMCLNAAGAPQGTAVVSGFQTRAAAR